MDWEKAAFALGGFVGGIITSLIKAILPTYMELAKENRELRAELAALREELRGLEDTIDDDERK